MGGQNPDVPVWGTVAGLGAECAAARTSAVAWRQADSARAQLTSARKCAVGARSEVMLLIRSDPASSRHVRGTQSGQLPERGAHIRPDPWVPR